MTLWDYVSTHPFAALCACIAIFLTLNNWIETWGNKNDRS